MHWMGDTMTFGDATRPKTCLEKQNQVKILKKIVNILQSLKTFIINLVPKLSECGSCIWALDFEGFVDSSILLITDRSARDIYKVFYKVHRINCKKFNRIEVAFLNKTRTIRNQSCNEIPCKIYEWELQEELRELTKN